MTKKQAIVYLRFSGFSEEQIKAIEGAFTCDKCVYSTSEGCQYDDITETIPPFDDCISRQAAIDALTKTSGIRGDALKALYELSSVSPQPCEDTISRQAAIDACIRVREHRAYDEIEEIKALPSAQPERLKGHWIIDGHHIQCSVCAETMCNTDREGDKIPMNFCPNCGADMRGEQDG